MSKQISPLPWKRRDNLPECINDAKGDYIVDVMQADYGDEDLNAAFIVKAVNNHDALVRALRAASRLILDEVVDGGYTEQYALCRDALAAVEA